MDDQDKKPVPASTQNAGAPQDETPGGRRPRRQKQTAPGISAKNRKPRPNETEKSEKD